MSKCPNEWIDVKEKLPDQYTQGIIKVKRENGDIVNSYFHKDQMLWLTYYSDHKISHFQQHDNLKWLYDVTHWKDLKD